MSSEESTVKESTENTVTPTPKSEFKGVYYFKNNKKKPWVAKALVSNPETGKNKMKHIGYFSSQEEANEARLLFLKEKTENVLD